MPCRTVWPGACPAPRTAQLVLARHTWLSACPAPRAALMVSARDTWPSTHSEPRTAQMVLARDPCLVPCGALRPGQWGKSEETRAHPCPGCHRASVNCMPEGSVASQGVAHQRICTPVPSWPWAPATDNWGIRTTEEGNTSQSKTLKT